MEISNSIKIKTWIISKLSPLPLHTPDLQSEYEREENGGRKQPEKGMDAKEKDKPDRALCNVTLSLQTLYLMDYFGGSFGEPSLGL